jgi:hypothetical protein
MAVEIPANFPRGLLPGSVPGAQPKLLVRKVGDKYLAGMTDEECEQRYEICIDLSQQLISYCRRKQEMKPEWSTGDILRETSQGIRSKNWDLSEAEILWTMERVAHGLHWTQPKQ